ncbi:MAG: VOC family protein [Pseudobacteriovorax sp.]|nr:VOC family protein [Pseudobacteriovorax sp.]
MEWNRFAIMLICSDVDKAKDFYVNHLGLTINSDIGWFVGLELENKKIGRLELSLCQEGHPSLPKQNAQASKGVVLALGTEDVNQVFESFQNKDIPILSELKDEPWGQRHFFAEGPDGVSLDIFQLIEPDPKWMKENGFY